MTKSGKTPNAAASSKTTPAAEGRAGTNSVGEALTAAAGGEEGVAAFLQEGGFLGGTGAAAEDQGSEGQSAESAGAEAAASLGESGSEEGNNAEGAADAEAGGEETDEGAEESESTDGDEAAAEEGADAQAGKAAEKPKLSAEAQAILDKRIAKEVAKTKRLQEEHQRELMELQTKLEEATSGVSAKAAPAVLENIQTREQLEKFQADNEQAYEWADELLLKLRRNPSAVASELAANKINLGDEVSEEKIEEFLLSVRSKANRQLRQDIPKRGQYLQAQAQAEEAAVKVFPWWQDKASEEYAEAQRIVKAAPYLKQDPQWKFNVGIFLVGLAKIREDAAKAKANKGKEAATSGSRVERAPTEQREIPRPPKLGSRAHAPAAINGKAAAQSSKKNRFIQTGNVEDLAGAIEALI